MGHARCRRASEVLRCVLPSTKYLPSASQVHVGADARRELSWAVVPQSLDVRRQHSCIESRRVGEALTLSTLRPSMNSTVRLLALIARR
eukprot:2151622-Prymnesium_polylepis.1